MKFLNEVCFLIRYQTVSQTIPNGGYLQNGEEDSSSYRQSSFRSGRDGEFTRGKGFYGPKDVSDDPRDAYNTAGTSTCAQQGTPTGGNYCSYPPGFQKITNKASEFFRNGILIWNWTSLYGNYPFFIDPQPKYNSYPYINNN